MRDCAGGATQAFRIEDGDRVLRGAYDDIERLSGVRPAINAAIEYRGLGNQHVSAGAGFADLKTVAAAVNLRVNARTIIPNQNAGLIVSDGGVQFHFLKIGSRSEIITPGAGAINITR